MIRRTRFQMKVPRRSAPGSLSRFLDMLRRPATVGGARSNPRDDPYSPSKSPRYGEAKHLCGLNRPVYVGLDAGSGRFCPSLAQLVLL